MMRFVWIGDQIKLYADMYEETEQPPGTDFAFWNTCTNSFVEFFGSCVFDSVEDFKRCYSWHSDKELIIRLLNLVPEELFTTKTREQYIEELSKALSYYQSKPSEKDILYSLLKIRSYMNNEKP